MAHSLPSSGNARLSGLQHLVDAATALTQLVSSVPAGNQQEGRSHMIRDDEETRRARLACQNQSVMPSFRHVPLAPNGAIPLRISLGLGKSMQGHCLREIFPQRLISILSDHSISDIITWLPHGRAFVIIRAEDLAERILPKYFPESSANSSKSSSTACKYPSFTRKLNRWGFRQVTRGPDAGAFHHKFFRRDEPSLCLQMICQRSRRRKGDEKSDVVNILPRNISQMSINTAISVTDSESISSGSNKTNAPHTRSGHPTNKVYCTKSPIAIMNNSAVVSNTVSPAPQRIPNVSTMTDIHRLQGQQNNRPLTTNRQFTQHIIALNATASISAPTKQSNTGPETSYADFQQPCMPPLNHLPTMAPPPAPTTTFHNPTQRPIPLLRAVDESGGVPVNLSVAAESSQVSVPFPVQGGDSDEREKVSEEDVRIANAKSMLYNAYLKALG